MAIAIVLMEKHADMIKMLCHAARKARGDSFIGRTRFYYNEDDSHIYALCANDFDPEFFRHKDMLRVESTIFQFFTVGSVSEKPGSYQDFMDLSVIPKVFLFKILF